MSSAMSMMLSLGSCLISTLAVLADDPAVAPQQLGRVLPPSAIPFDEAAAAGLPKDSHAQVLSLERAYHLALIRARAGRAAGAPKVSTSLEPKLLADLCKRYEVSDFASFRKDFL